MKTQRFNRPWRNLAWVIAGVTCSILTGFGAQIQFNPLKEIWDKIPKTTVPQAPKYTPPQPTATQEQTPRATETVSSPAALIDQYKAEFERKNSRSVLQGNSQVTYVQGVCSRVLPDNLKSSVSVKVLRDGALATYSFPDGTIYVTTGLLSSLSNEAELAAALARESVIVDVRVRDFHQITPEKKKKSLSDLLNLPGVKEALGATTGAAVGGQQGVVTGVAIYYGLDALSKAAAQPGAGAGAAPDLFRERLAMQDRLVFDNPDSKAMELMNKAGYPASEYASFIFATESGNAQLLERIQQEFSSKYSVQNALANLRGMDYRAQILAASF